MAFTMKDVDAYLLVVANNQDYYDGLVGEIEEVRHDKEDFESENDSDLEIVTNFMETSNMKDSHPDLNGTGVTDLLMGEDDLIYFPNGLSKEGYDSKGNVYAFDDVVCNYPGYKEQVMKQWPYET